MESNKKIILFYVLDVLRSYSDENHLMTYGQIKDKLHYRYDIEPDTKSIASNIGTLMEAGFEIVKCGYKGCYLEHGDFLDEELTLIIKAILAYPSISPTTARELILKLTKDTSIHKRKEYMKILPRQ